MKLFFATVLMAGTFSTFAAGKLSLSVELNPAGSFQAETDKVKGEITKAKDGTVSAKELTVPVKSMKTGIDLRNEHFWKHLNGEKFPKAVLSDVKGKDGQATGMLEVAGVKKPITISYTEADGKINANFKVKASDFKLPTAQYLGVGVEDDVQGNVTLPFKSI